MNINNLFSIPQNAIWAFVNEVDRRVYIGHSERAVGAIGQAINEIQRGVHKWIPGGDLNKLSLVVLESFDNSIFARMRIGQIVDKYRKDGYSLYRKYNHEVKFKLEEGYLENKYYGLWLKAGSGEEIVVGVFNTRNECIEYRNTYYKNLDKIAYCENELTKRYYAK